MASALVIRPSRHAFQVAEIEHERRGTMYVRIRLGEQLWREPAPPLLLPLGQMMTIIDISP